MPEDIYVNFVPCTYVEYADHVQSGIGLNQGRDTLSPQNPMLSLKTTCAIPELLQKLLVNCAFN